MGINDNVKVNKSNPRDAIRRIKAYVQKLEAVVKERFDEVKSSVESTRGVSIRRVIKEFSKVLNSHAKINELGIFEERVEKLNEILVDYESKKKEYKEQYKELFKKAKKCVGNPSSIKKVRVKIKEARSKFKEERLVVAQSIWKLIEPMTADISRLLDAIPKFNTADEIKNFNIVEWKKKASTIPGTLLNKLKEFGDVRILRAELEVMGEQLRKFGRLNKRFIKMVKGEDVDMDEDPNLVISGPG